MMQCWKERTVRKECPLAKCCYEAGAQALFEYWKYANSEEWKKRLAEALEEEKKQ